MYIYIYDIFLCARQPARASTPRDKSKHVDLTTLLEYIICYDV